MKLLYNPQDGEVFYAVKGIDFPYFTHSTNIPLSVMEIDEIEENRFLLAEIIKCVQMKDINGLGRWYVENGELYERDGWERYEQS